MIVSTLGTPIAATLLHATISAATATSPNADLYLYNAAGTLLTKSVTTSRQETLTYKPTAAGTYALRVKSASGVAPYRLDLSTNGTVSHTVTATPTSLVPTGDVNKLKTDDNAYVAYSGPGTVTWTAVIAGVPSSATNFTINYRGKSSAKQCTQVVALANGSTWETLDSRLISTSELTITKALTGSGRFALDGTVQVQIRCTTTGTTSLTSSGEMLSPSYNADL